MSYILLDNIDTYFEVLPPEINLLIVSKLSNKTLRNHTSLLIYQTSKGLLNNNTWSDLFILKYPDEYNFIISTKNIVGEASWQTMFIFYLHSYLELEKTGIFPSISGYMSDIFNLNMIKLKYPKFYNEVKHVNLDVPGASFGMYFYREPTISKWYTVGFWVDKIKEFGVVNGKYDEKYTPTYDPIHEINLMVTTRTHSVETKYILLLLTYVISKHKDPGKIRLGNLFFLFSTNLDAYSEIISRINITQLPDPNLTNYNELLRDYNPKPYERNLFIYDIKSRYLERHK